MIVRDGTAVAESAGVSLGELRRRATEVADWCARHASAIDTDGAFPVEEFRRIGEAGLLAAPLRQRLGGLGLGSEPGRMGDALDLLRVIGRGNLSVGRLFEGHVNALGLIHTFGTVEQVERCAGDARERRLFSVWNTEAADGARLVPTGRGRHRLEGKKTFASGAGWVDRPLLTAALPDGGWQMVVLSVAPGELAVDPHSWRPLGMKASASFTADVGGIEVGPEDLLGEPGDYYRQPWFGGGAIRFSAVQLGGAEAMLQSARDELRALGRTDDPLQRVRFGEAEIALETGRLWLRAAAERADDSALGGCPDGSLGAEAMVVHANMTRTAIERVCLAVMERVERSVGARGLLRPHPIERIGRDLTLYLRQPAPDAVLSRIGQAVLSGEAAAPTDASSRGGSA